MIFILYSTALLLFYLYLRISQHNKNRKSALWLFHFCFIFALYAVFEALQITELSPQALFELLFQTIYMSFISMTFSKEFLGYQQVFYYFGDPDLVKLQVWFVLLMSSFFTAQFFVLAFLGNQFNQFKLNLRMKFQKEIIFAAGDGKNVLELNRSLIAHDKNTVLVWFVKPESLTTITAPPNVILKSLNNIEEWINTNKLIRRRIFKGLIMFDNADINIGILGLIEKLYKGNPNLNDNLKLTVLCDHEYLRLSHWKTNLDVYFVSEAHMIARQTLSQHSIIDVLKRRNHIIYDESGFALLNKDVNICIVGFTEYGQELLLLTYENSRFLREDYTVNKFHVDILDEDFNKSAGTFLESMSFFIQTTLLNFIEAPLRSQKAIKALKENIEKYDVIYFTSDSDEANVKSALALIRFIEEKGITTQPEINVFIKEGTSYLHEFGKSIYTDYKYLRIMNISNEFFTYDNLVSRKVEDESRRYHEWYNSLKKNINQSFQEQSYRELNTFLKASNRELVHDIHTKLEMIGEQVDSEPNIKANSEKLAMYEHYRWCAFHIARGWRPLAPDSRTDKEIREGTSKRAEQKKHLCLVNWDELENRFREYNIEQIKLFVKFIKE